MTDRIVPEAKSEAPATQEQGKADPTLGPRRLLVMAISAVLGVVSTALGLLAIRAPLDATFLVAFVELPVIVLAAIPMYFFFLIWVDYFMGTKIVPD
jgi:hypothetical protein